MRIVYIAGPYNGPDYVSIDRNIAKAREAAAWCAENGIGFFCPHLNSAHFEAITPTVPESFWKALDLELLKECDAMLLIEGWRNSSGAQAELGAFQAQHGLQAPVFEWAWREKLLAWVIP